MNIPSLQDQYKQSHGDYRKELQLIYEHEREQANSFTKYYYNLRLTALSFLLVSLGAMSAFIWNEGYRAEYNVLPFVTKMLRLIMLVIMPVFTVNYYLLERTLRFRYDIAWDEALAYEELLVGEGFHTRIR